VTLAPDLDVFTRTLEAVYRHTNACWHPYPVEGDQEDVAQVFLDELDGLAPGLFDRKTSSREVWSWLYAGIAKSALATFEAIQHTAAEFADAVRGRVRLGMIMGCSIPAFLDTVADLGRTHPGIELSLHEGYSDDLQTQGLSSSLDLALIGYAGDVAPGLEVGIVIDEPITTVVPAGHPLDRTELRLADLWGEKVLCLSPAPAFAPPTRTPATGSASTHAWTSTPAPRSPCSASLSAVPAPPFSARPPHRSPACGLYRSPTPPRTPGSDSSPAEASTPQR
jgi:hypothetical protein